MADERLQKVLAAAGIASRRACETLIAGGHVTVDGRRATLGDRVNPATARIEVDGLPVGVGAARAYVAVHKPMGVTSTVRDRHAEVTVLDLLPTALVPDGTRLFPVGRLDRDSEGLLLLTNDGDWAERVLHPRFEVQREYAVGLAQPLTPDQASALAHGIQLDEGVARLAAPLRPATGIETRRLQATLDPPVAAGLTWYRAILEQGWKRQLRRMFAATGAPVQRLVRVRIGPVMLGELGSGRARRLKAPEIRAVTAPAARTRSGSATASGAPAAARRSVAGPVDRARPAGGRRRPGVPPRASGGYPPKR
jgi:23S rRNA pseudouridine2605 synthase